jgi:hypothetical protein
VLAKAQDLSRIQLPQPPAKQRREPLAATGVATTFIDQ